MSSLKAEILHQYYKTNGIPLRAKAFANITQINNLGAILPSFSNLFLKGKAASALIKKVLKIAPQRSLPPLHETTLRKWFNKNRPSPKQKTKTVYLFCDEFTNYNDTPIGINAIKLLTNLGYEVKMIAHSESGRAALSKGLLTMAQDYAKKNIAIFKKLISEDTPLLGIEPSAILSFRDEYPRLVAETERPAAKQVANNTFLIDEFLAAEIHKGNIRPEQFTDQPKHILLHGHCHQKALASVESTAWLLSLPTNYTVEIIPSGCCGMAGSFGYEAEHYEVSMQIGELVLFPALRKAQQNTLIAATGTSCRHQIRDGVQKEAFHPVEILWNALI